ncbi:MAG: ATP-binding protein [Acidobacteriota bacterium]
MTPTWNCNGCERAMMGIAPSTSLCLDCELRALEDAKVAYRRAFRAGADRSEVLTARGWHAALLHPFDAPGAWPRHPEADHPQKAGVDLAAWRGGRWASVLILGAVGSGKSYFATELAWRWWLDGSEVRFATGAGLVARVFGGDWDELERARNVDLLVLDDFDRGVSARGFDEVVQPVLLHRLGDCRPVVLTTNTPMTRGAAGIPTLFQKSAAIADRLRDGLIVPVGGPSRRGRR